jgi:hypothetical protein
VVRTKPSTRVLYVLLLVGMVLEVMVMAGLVWLMFWSAQPGFIAILPLLVLQLGFMIPIVGEYQGLLGPQLAADHSGVWVRTGLGRRPEVVYLPWPSIDGVDAVRRGPALRIMSREGEALFPKRAHWRVRVVRRRLGTPFMVDGRRSAVHPAELSTRLVSH